MRIEKYKNRAPSPVFPSGTLTIDGSTCLTFANQTSADDFTGVNNENWRKAA